MTKVVLDFQGNQRLLVVEALNNFVELHPQSSLNIVPDNIRIEKKAVIRLTVAGEVSEIDSLIEFIDSSL